MTETVTIAEVARLAGVAQVTVSRVLAGKGYVSPRTRDAVHQAVEALGYRPSYLGQTLATGRTRNVAVVVPTLGRRLLVDMLRGASAELRKERLCIAVLEVGDDATTSLGPLHDRGRFDGLIIAGVSETLQMAGDLFASGLPVVSVQEERSSRSPDVDSVATHCAIAHARLLGHHAIAYIGIAEIAVDHTSYDSQRRSEFIAAISDGLVTGPVVEGDSGVSAGFAAAVLLLSDDTRRPTLVIAATDEIAVGAMSAAQRLGLQVPDELSVISLEDQGIGEPLGLTTFNLNPFSRGREAARRLLTQMDGNPRVVNGSEREPTMIIRRSTTAVACTTPEAA